MLELKAQVVLDWQEKTPAYADHSIVFIVSILKKDLSRFLSAKSVPLGGSRDSRTSALNGLA